MSDWAIDGQPYSALKKGGSSSAYADSIAAVTKAFSLLAASVVPAVFCVHGEANASDVNYAADLAQWQSDYEGDIQAATGQVNAVPMFVSQWQKDRIGLGQFLDAYLANPTKTILVCPKYFLPHSDSLHLTSAAYVILGEYYAKAYRQVVIQGQTWTPLRPLSISRIGAVVTLQYTGMVGNLVFDTTTVTQQSDGNYGFVYSNSGVTVSSVAITDAAAGVVQVTLTAPPVNAFGTDWTV